MSSPFAITAATNSVRLDADRRGVASFTVFNSSGRAIRGRVQLVPEDPAVAAWLTLEGDAERDLVIAGTEQYTVQIVVPPDTPAGSYSFRLDAVGVENPDEEYAAGPTVTFVVPAPTAQKKPFPWWILLVIGAVLVGCCCLVLGCGLVVAAWPGGGGNGGGGGGGGGDSWTTEDRHLIGWERDRPTPDLAVSWEVAPNGMSYTLQLEEGVRLADGRAFNATTAREILNENTGRLPIAAVSIIDDRTIRIDLTMADIDYAFLQKMSEITIATRVTR